MSKSSTYVITSAGQYEGTMAACRIPVRTTRYESVDAAMRDLAMVRQVPRDEMVSVRGDGGWYVYDSEEAADRDDTGARAVAVIERKAAPSIRLCASGMGDDATEADYDAFVAFVSGRIDERCGFAVQVDSALHYECGYTQYRGDDDDRETMQRAHDALWEEFCATPEAWPSAEANA